MNFRAPVRTGNGISPNVKSQGQWIHLVKTDSCESCHQLGNEYTRTIPAMFKNFDSPAKAWERRVQFGASGQRHGGRLRATGAAARNRRVRNLDRPHRARANFPPQAPPRPQGVERNVVITQWDWADPKAYLHDEISTDKRNPNLNAERPDLWIAGGEPRFTSGARSGAQHHQPGEGSLSRCEHSRAAEAAQPSAVWGDEAIWDSHATVHNPMFDNTGGCGSPSRHSAPDNPAFCKAGSSQPSAKLTPVDRSGRQLAVYDPKTKQVSLIDTCFATHHLLFAEDANNTLWTSSGGGGGVVGWLNTKVWDQTHDAQKSQGWTALVLDTNGNGKRDAYEDVEQNVAVTRHRREPGHLGGSAADCERSKKDTRLNAAFYGLAIGTDGIVWGSVLGFPGGIVRVIPGSNPPETALAEYYEVPWNNPKAQGVRASRRAAWISIATTWPGWCWEADIWPASIAANAKVR